MEVLGGCSPVWWVSQTPKGTSLAGSSLQKACVPSQVVPDIQRMVAVLWGLRHKPNERVAHQCGGFLLAS